MKEEVEEGRKWEEKETQNGGISQVNESIEVLKIEDRNSETFKIQNQGIFKIKCGKYGESYSGTSLTQNLLIRKP